VESKFGEVSSDFSYDEVSCEGTEKFLEECQHQDFADCGTQEGAGVVCQNNIGNILIKQLIINLYKESPTINTNLSKFWVAISNSTNTNSKHAKILKCNFYFKLDIFTS
jgi:hypothetical protein